MAKEKSIETTFQFGKEIFSVADSVTTIGIAEALAPMLFFISLCINYTSAFISSKANSPKFYDASEFKRTIITMVLIPIAPGIIYLIFQVGEISAQFFNISDEERLQNYATIFKRMNEIEISFFEASFNTLMILLSMFFIGLSTIVKSAVIILTGFLKGFFVIVSPLALAFSILPFLKEQFIKLVKICLNISFILLTLNILDMMFFKSLLEVSDKLKTLPTYEFSLFMGAISFSLCILHIMCMWITSTYIGDPSSSAILTTATTVATASIMAAMKAFSALKNSGGSGNDITKEGGDLAKDIAETSIDSKDKK